MIIKGYESIQLRFYKFIYIENNPLLTRSVHVFPMESALRKLPLNINATGEHDE